MACAVRGAHLSIRSASVRTEVKDVVARFVRAVFDNVVVAEYHCHDDWRSRHVTNIRDGVFYRTRYASSQGALLPITPQESRVLHRPPSGRRRRRQAFPAQQLLLFEWIPTA